MRCWDACFLFSSNFFKGKTSLANQGEIKDLPPCCSLFNWPEEKEVPVMYGSCSFWFQSRAITAGLAVGELACESSASWKSSNRWPAQEQMENCCGLCHCEIVDIKEFQARFHCFSLAFSICLWKNVRRVNKNMRRVCQPPLVCDLCVGCHLLDVTYCSQGFKHFIFYLTPPKSTFHPQKSENSSLGKSTWRFWVLGTPSQLPTPFLGRSSGWSSPWKGPCFVSNRGFHLPCIANFIRTSHRTRRGSAKVTDDHPNDRLKRSQSTNTMLLFQQK